MRLIESLGAGKLTAKLYRRDDHSYCFEIAHEDGQELSTNDLEHLIKLGELIAWHVLDDGWSSTQQRDYVRSLYDQLKEVSRQ